ncbi:hypothetical protein BDR06DRAFT_66205 [Suillus hirtellus]|nr:hypothetical protein BDR06DRAFT_66205 [Suillus hirtellus]
MLLHRISALFVVLRALQMHRDWVLTLTSCRSRSSTVAVAVLAPEFQCRSILCWGRSVASSVGCMNLCYTYLWQQQSTAINQAQGSQ